MSGYYVQIRVGIDWISRTGVMLRSSESLALHPPHPDKGLLTNLQKYPG